MTDTEIVEEVPAEPVEDERMRYVLVYQEGYLRCVIEMYCLQIYTNKPRGFGMVTARK